MICCATGGHSSEGGALSISTPTTCTQPLAMHRPSTRHSTSRPCQMKPTWREGRGRGAAPGCALCSSLSCARAVHMMVSMLTGCPGWVIWCARTSSPADANSHSIVALGNLAMRASIAVMRRLPDDPAANSLPIQDATRVKTC